MRTIKSVFIFSLLIVLGCTSFPKKEESVKPIALLDVEQIHIGQDGTPALQQRFGNPTKIVSINQTNDVWAYNGYRYGV